jgi:hypothetical protein
MTEEINEPKPVKKVKRLKNVYGTGRKVVTTNKARKSKTKTKGKPGRPPKKKVDKIPGKPGRPAFCMPFADARDIIRAEGLSSLSDYHRWWNANVPARIPKNPQRSYQREWQGWGDFLNSYNVFPELRPVYRDYHEARDYARSLRLKTKDEWLEAYRAGKIPKDIPMWPNISYGRSIRTAKPKRGGHWIGWRDWLGASLADQMISLKKRVSVLVIATSSSFPRNAYAFSVLQGFESDIKIQLVGLEMEVHKVYLLEERFDWGGYVSMMYKKYYDGVYLIPNINEVYFYFDTFMDQVEL